MTRILTVTLNPALDVSTDVAEMVPEHKLRCSPPVFDAGGGGVNVARAITFLGGHAEAFVALGGFHGEQHLHLLRQDGVEVIPFKTYGETRQSLDVTDRASGLQYRFLMPGPEWSPEMEDAALAAVAEAVPAGGIVVLSGSQPPGVAKDFPLRMVRQVAEKGALMVLDTSGPALHALLDNGATRGHILRMDEAEAAGLAGKQFAGLPELAQFVSGLVRDGVARMVLVGISTGGSVLATDYGCWHAVTPPVKVRSKVGAGDSFVGAFTLSLANGDAPEEALRRGVAAASAAVMSDATKLCQPAEVDQLAAQTSLTRL